MQWTINRKHNIETINSNTCCMCFGFFGDDVYNENGAGWVSYNCGGWLHEDCVEDYVINKIGVELFINFVLKICCIKCNCACYKLCTMHHSNSTHSNEK